MEDIERRALRDAELTVIARAAALEAFTGGAGELLQLGATAAPTKELVNRIAGRAGRTVVERTQVAQPFDGGDLAIVVTEVTAAFLEIYLGTLRVVTANATRAARE